MSKVSHYIVGFGEKTAKFELLNPILLVTVYVAPLATKKNNVLQ